MAHINITVTENITMATTYRVDAGEFTPEELTRIRDRYGDGPEPADPAESTDDEDEGIRRVIELHTPFQVSYRDPDEDRGIRYEVLVHADVPPDARLIAGSRPTGPKSALCLADALVAHRRDQPVVAIDAGPDERETVMSPGTVLYGHCNGYFGHSYGEKVVIACRESNDDLWIVARDEDDGLLFATGFPREFVAEWMSPEYEEG